ncbi:MAG: peptide chain release factor 1 [Candidatus Riflebacteria bacterium]|nr:peptide chain release factor 1 [Candidatus Riflebacteria bacterium]
MLEKLESVKENFKELTDKLTNPEVIANQAEFQRLAKKRSEMESIVNAYDEYTSMLKKLKDAESMVESETDPELKELAELEVSELKPQIEKMEGQLKLLLIPKDEDDQKNTIFEIRAGTGGEEAALFAADLYRMYTRYAEKQGWKCELMSMNDTGLGGIKEVVFSIQGNGVFGKLKFESGVHRVQRVPETEAGGRIHTSAATVAVLPEAEEVDVQIDENDLRVDVFRASGPGGQCVNRTDSAVRITHLPTGLVVSCQDEKSQHKNKAKAIRILRARLFDKVKEEKDSARAENRRNQVGSGDRSERIRTYNFPQQRLTDHRINLTLYKLDEVMEGNLEEIIDALIEADNLRKLAEEEAR